MVEFWGSLHIFSKHFIIPNDKNFVAALRNGPHHGKRNRNGNGPAGRQYFPADDPERMLDPAFRRDHLPAQRPETPDETLPAGSSSGLGDHRTLYPQAQRHDPEYARALFRSPLPGPGCVLPGIPEYPEG